MALIGSRTLQQNTSEMLDKAESGEPVVILRHGKPTTALVPIDQKTAEMLVFTSSPEFTERFKAREGMERTTEPFAVSEREIPSP